MATSLVPSWPAMRPITASWLVLMSVGLIWPADSPRRVIPVICGFVVIATAGLTLTQYALHLGPILDYLLFGDQIRQQPGAFAGRATPHVALASLLLASSVTLGHLRVRAAVTEGLALGASLIPVAGLLGYLLRASHLDLTGAGSSVGMAASTAIALLITAIAVLARRPPGGIREFASGSGAAALLVRRLLAPVLLFPVTTGALLIRSESDGRLAYPFAVALGLVVLGAGLTFLTLDLARRIDRQELELAHQTRFDALTGVVNRTAFTELVSQSLARPGHLPMEVGILYIDVDDFKSINDVHGHADGDIALRWVAEKLLDATRGSDEVGRLGGDEFAILMRNVHSDSDLRVVAERALVKLREPVPLHTGPIAVSVTIGVARAAPGMEVDELTRNADLAMYRAKQLGKGRYEMFVPELHDDRRDRQNVDTELRAAITRGELRVYYQPIVELQGSSVIGVEALVRWQHPTRGLLLPAAFLTVAERSGSIVPVGRWVIREACRQAAEWIRAGAPPSFTLSVNVSARQLAEPGLFEDTRSALAASGLAPERLVVELTESSIMSDLDALMPVLQEFKGLGVRLAIDDFGTGYSSLGYLQRLPVDILKIDKSFVDGVGHGGIDRALARTIVALTETLSLQAIAEGVESDSQRRHLGEIGCGYGQGYHFSEAVSGPEIERQLAEQRVALLAEPMSPARTPATG